MKPIENKTQTFTKLNDSLRRISVQKINSTQKIFFAYILGWQEKGKTLTATNKYIANQLGLTESGLRKAITTSNQKFDFFSSTQDDTKKRENGYTSTHEIKIDVDKYNEYLKLNHSKTSFYEDLNKPENEPDEVKEPIQPKQEISIDNELTEEIIIDNSTQTNNDFIKENLKEKYNSYFKNSNQDTTLSVARFHRFTDNYFIDKLTSDKILYLCELYHADAFDLFWNNLQQLKEAFGNQIPYVNDHLQH